MARPPHTFVAAAQQLSTGLRPLANADRTCESPLALLAAQVVECALKAFLSRSGDDKRLKKPAIRHDLEGLWLLAQMEGLPIGQSPPPWLQLLSKLHRSPYPLRYAKDVFLIALPPSEPMLTEIEELLQVVAASLANP